MVGLFWIVVIVIVCTYCANLTVYLTVFERKLPFSDLVEAIQDPSVEFYVTPGTVGRNMLQASKNYIDLFKLIQKSSPIRDHFLWVRPSQWETMLLCNDVSHCGPFYLHGLALIPAWISNFVHYKVSNEVTSLKSPFPNINGSTVEVWKGICNFITHFT